MEDSTENKVVFFHDNKRKNETLGLQDKLILSEYSKNRRAIKKAKDLLSKEKGYVTKSNYELVMGVPPNRSYFYKEATPLLFRGKGGSLNGKAYNG